MVRLVIFDMDQTLVDAFRTHDAALAACLQETYGVEGGYGDLPGRGAGVRISVSITELAAKKGVPMEVAVAKSKEALTRYEEHFVHGLPAEMPPLPGVLKLLKALRERGVRLALVTGSPERLGRALLRSAGIEEYFSAAVFGEEAQTREGLVRRALEKAKVPAGDAVAVGDSVHDVTSAKAAGVRVVAVATGPYSREQLAAERPDAVFETLADPRVLELLA